MTRRLLVVAHSPGHRLCSGSMVVGGVGSRGSGRSSSSSSSSSNSRGSSSSSVGDIGSRKEAPLMGGRGSSLSWNASGNMRGVGSQPPTES